VSCNPSAIAELLVQSLWVLRCMIHFVVIPFCYLNQLPRTTQPGIPLWVGTVSTGDGFVLDTVEERNKQ